MNKKRVVIDCRYLGMSGIGRFLEGILDEFDYESFEVTLLGKLEKIQQYRNCKYIIDDSSPFSVKCLFKTNIKMINKCDMFFSPNFIIPYGIKTEIITVIHDVIYLDIPEVNNSFIDKQIKKYLLKRAIKKSNKVLTVSKFSYDRILYYFPKAKNKLLYAYQGINKNIKKYDLSNVVKRNYMIFVGNIKKHKGLKTLLEAYEIVKDEIELVVVGDDKGFKNCDQEVCNLISENNIKFTGKVSDEELFEIIANAKFLIQPSLYEGFGLPPLEALYLGTKPIISDIKVFKEIYSDLPVEFFKRSDCKELAHKISSTKLDLVVDKQLIDEKFSYKNFINEIGKK